MTQPYQFLTLTPPEARLIVAALNGHLVTPGIAATDELRLSLADSCGPRADGERLDLAYGVADWERLVAAVSGLTEERAAAVLAAAAAFWDGDLDLYTDEALGAVGLL
ncbi:MAG: hypothetical protein FJ318_06155 [SAR202 cluster bacterium]|nr:hypothetical protein [SAR202 cluster bacterium]